MKKVCAIIVTFNRAELLCRCVKAILNQTYPVHILIYDNHSKKPAEDILRQEGIPIDDKFSFTYYYADENSGGAGGFHNGLKMAMEKGFDEFILMDDDGYPINKDTISELIKAREIIGVNSIVNSLVVCNPDTLQLSFSLNRSYDGHKIQNMATDGLVEKYISPFNGTMISSEIVRKIGYPRKEFFVYGDETEYTFRALKYGYSLYTAVNSLYFHPTYLGAKRKILGYTFSVDDIPMWKVYCSSRNTTYYTRLYFGYLTLLKSILRSYISVVICKSKHIKRFIYTTKGIIDGLRGDFSRKLDLTV